MKFVEFHVHFRKFSEDVTWSPWTSLHKGREVMKLVKFDEVFVKSKRNWKSRPSLRFRASVGCQSWVEWPKNFEKWESIVFCAEGSRLDRSSSCSGSRNLWRCTWRNAGSVCEWSWWTDCPSSCPIWPHRRVIADLLDANMFKVYADMLKRDKHTIVGIQGHWCLCSNPWTRCSCGRWGRGKRWGGLKTS